MKPIKFGVMVELYPNSDKDPPKIVLAQTIFDTRENAQGYIDEARRQNLPYKGKWIIEFTDPRG